MCLWAHSLSEYIPILIPKILYPYPPVQDNHLVLIAFDLWSVTYLVYTDYTPSP